MMIDRTQSLSRALNRSKTSGVSQKSRKALLSELDAQSAKAESTKRPVEVADVEIEMKKSVVVDWKDEEDPVMVLEAARARQFLESSQDEGALSQSQQSEIGEYKPQYSDEPEIQVESAAKITPQKQTQAMIAYLRNNFEEVWGQDP